MGAAKLKHYQVLQNYNIYLHTFTFIENKVCLFNFNAIINATQYYISMDGTDQRTIVERVSVRVPPFWAADPAMWFSQLEAQFEVSNISQDSTKFNYVIANLEPRYATEIRDLIATPPETDKYTKIKRELIDRLSASQEDKTRRLLEHEVMGDRKPSQFLRHLRNLAGEAVPITLIRSLWLSRLPPAIRAILATQADSDTDTIAKMADAVHDATAIPTVSTITNESQIQEIINQVTKELKQELTAIVRSGNAGNNYRNRKQHQQRSRSKSRDRQREQAKQGICFYHSRFGKAANKCTKPCNFQENPQGSR